MKRRWNAIVNEETELHYFAKKSGSLYDIYQWNKIEIYDTDPSQGSPTPIQVIASTGIERVGLGEYKYIMNPVSVGNKYYYDKQYYIPEEGASEVTDIEKVWVNEAVYEGGMLLDLCTVFGTIYGIDGKPVQEAEVVANVIEVPSFHETMEIVFGIEPVKVLTNESGQFYINLVKGSKVTLNIPIIGYKRDVFIPGDTDSINFRYLSEV